MRRQRDVIAAATLLALTAGCVAEPLDAALPDDADVLVVAEDIFFAPDRIEVPAGEVVRLHLRNDGGIVHDLVLDDGWESGDVLPGQGATFELGPRTTSTVAWCSIPGHRDAGMELEIVVTDG
jgi:nitrite reductase (NO-forming)